MFRTYLTKYLHSAFGVDLVRLILRVIAVFVEEFAGTSSDGIRTAVGIT